MLQIATDEYNAQYTIMYDCGMNLYVERERAKDLIINVENLVNSIANHPKSFDSEISEIKMNREEFQHTCDFAKQELDAARKSAISAFLAMAGSIGWTIAGATLLTSIVLFTRKKMKTNKERKEEIEKVKINIETVTEAGSKIKNILDKTSIFREELNNKYGICLSSYEKSFLKIPEEQKMELGVLVNNTKALAITLGENI